MFASPPTVGDDRARAERPVGAHPVDRVVTDRDVEDAAHKLAVHKWPLPNWMPSVWESLRVVEVVDVAVLHGDVLVDVEAVLAAVDVQPAGVTLASPTAVPFVFGSRSPCLRDAALPRVLTVATEDRVAALAAGDLRVADHHPGRGDANTPIVFPLITVFGVEIVEGPVYGDRSDPGRAHRWCLRRGSPGGPGVTEDSCPARNSIRSPYPSPSVSRLRGLVW